MSRLASLAMVLVASVAWPCGPDFPTEYLSNRAQTLSQLPDSLFFLEATRLVAAPPMKFVNAEGVETPGARAGGDLKERTLYLKAAQLWNAHDEDRAAAVFRSLLQLPESQRKRFTIPAEFMLARSAATPDDAHRWFASVRAHASAGFDDALGLALASLGDEAHLWLVAGDDAKAVQLYALQAAHGSLSAVASLLMVSRQLATDSSRFWSASRDPLVQRLLSMYLWTRGTESWWSDETEHSPRPQLLGELSQLESVAGGAPLAAALYRAGRFEEAEHFAKTEDAPVSHWVLAKLALRRGDIALADEELATAERGIDPKEDWSERQADLPHSRIEVERTILALKRNEFDSAMRHVLISCSWQDIAYVAERLVDVDSLKRVVDSLPAVDPCGPITERDDSWSNPPIHRSLRTLLARRLLRTERGRESLSYFDVEHREAAEAYVAALEQTKTMKTKFERAAQLLEAAKLLKKQGMELIGTEVAPDFRWTGGYFDPFYGEWHLHFDSLDAGLSPQELSLERAAAPKDDVRFHYRTLASRLTEQAADQLSHRSQAFTSLLCESAKPVMDLNPERAAALWRRSVREGPLLKEPMVFGRECPTPRFVEPPEPRRAKWQFRKRTVVLISAWSLVLVAGIGAGLRRRKRAS